MYYTTRPEDSLNSWLIARTTQEKYQLTKLIPNATYYVKVNAFNAAGDGPVSEQLPIVVTPGDRMGSPNKTYSPFAIKKFPPLQV
ncbi:unnamed protein product [Schistosoma margrebowiei]|uniref:Fibronectin type-III domain-containing protein n=1 Tax=Schistosoma margrebowiei TaxID=48269 RepID=A0A3P8DRX2_9TREM|nr:unnamed protein product [Schistosoma margrebowiei]